MQNHSMKRITLDLEDEMYKSLKIFCATEGCSMVDVIRELLELHLARQKADTEVVAASLESHPSAGSHGKTDYAELTILQLKNIFVNDAEFTKAHEHVKAWIDRRVPEAEAMTEADDKAEEESWARKDAEYMAKIMGKRHSKDFGPCTGMRYADVAITQLEKISGQDIQFRKACRRVLSFIDTRLKAFKLKKY